MPARTAEDFLEFSIFWFMRSKVWEIIHAEPIYDGDYLRYIFAQAFLERFDEI